MLIIGIPSANRPEAIKRLIPAILAQDLDSDYRIVVANGTIPDRIDTKLVHEEYIQICSSISNLSIINNAGGPSSGRWAITDRCAPDDTIIFLDDDTFPSHPRTLSDLLSFFRSSDNIDIASAIWNCQKDPNRPYGSILQSSNGFVHRHNIRKEGIHRVQIPLATFCTSGEIAKRLSFDQRIPFYGDLYDTGLSILVEDLNCFYSSEIVFDHKQIDNSFASTDYRKVDSWGYISSKWNVSFFIGNKLYSPLEGRKATLVQDKKYSDYIGSPQESSGNSVLCSRKLFLVELNKYHFETIPILVDLFRSLDIGITVVVLHNRLLDSADLSQKCSYIELDTPSQIVKYVSGKIREQDILFVNSAGVVDRSPITRVFNYDPSHLLLFRKAIKHAGCKIAAIHHDLSPTEVRKRSSSLDICLQPSMAKCHHMHYLPLVSEVDVNSENQGQEKRVVIAGLLDRSRRDYGGIIAAFKRYFSANPQSLIRLHFLGSYVPRDRDYFLELFKPLESEEFSGFFDISAVVTGGKINSKDFDYALSCSQFLLWGINPVLPDQFPYIYSKASGSFSLSMSHCLVPVVHANVAAAYDISKISITYSDYADLEKQLDRIDRLGAEDITGLKSALVNHSHRLRNTAIDTLKALLE